MQEGLGPIMATKNGASRITVYVPPTAYGSGSRAIGVLR